MRVRYFLKGGFLGGNFWQGLWYRCLVDREIGRMKRTQKTIEAARFTSE